MYEFDRRVEAYCRSVSVTYTRYADDLTFSTNKRQILTGVAVEVDRICHELPFPRLRLNTEKTVHASKATSRRVTGLVLSNEGRVSIGHRRKREIHAAVHYFKVGKLNADKTSALAGMLAFVNSVEPSFLRVLTKRYGRSVMKSLFQVKRD